MCCQVGQSTGNTAELRSEGNEFESAHGCRLFCPTILVFLLVLQDKC
jgi:hypothetical protein